MFTGIVETTAAVQERTPTGLLLEKPADFGDLALGCSVSVAGVCLTVVASDAATMSFSIVKETWARTSLGGLNVGDRVNVERSLSANGRFEGHVVQGHVEGVAEVTEVVEVQPQGKEITVRVPEELRPCVVPKGAIALDGVSLTVARLDRDLCTIALIPHTLAITTFGTRSVGDRVNVETDIFLRGLRHLRDIESR